MDLSDPEERAALRRRLGAVFLGRPVICGPGPLAQLTEQVSVLAEVGAERPLLICTEDGAGAVPEESQAQVVTIETPRFASVTEELRARDRQVRDLPAPARAALDRYDPAGVGVWFAGPFVSDEPIDGRAVLGGRPRPWTQLEDKLLAEEIWDAVGCLHAVSRIVAVERDELDAAGAELDLGHGVVWSGDVREGFNGGGDLVRWVTDSEERAKAFGFFRARCDRVRVMPFLEGVPCSIHGMVLDDGVAVFRPVELAILRNPARHVFVYGGQGTFWDPPDADRDQMRELVRRTGEHLRRWAGYRGAFGIDGVLTVDGFLPTEINTRLTGGLTGLARAADLALFQLLQVNLVLGRDAGLTASQLESWAVPAMDRYRVGKPVAVSGRRTVEEPTNIAVTWDGRDLRRADETGPADDAADDADVMVQVAPSSVGTFARLHPCRVLRPGDRIGPLNAALMRFLDDEIGTRFGPLEAPPDVRAGVVG